MSKLMDRSVDVDRVSVTSDGKTPTKDAVTEKLGKFRKSFSRAANGPFSSLRRKRPEVEAVAASDDPGSPSSPVTPSAGLSSESPVHRPPKNSGSGSSFQEKDGDEVMDGAQSGKPVARSKSYTAMSRLRGSFRKRKNKSMTINSKTGESSSEEKNEEEEEEEVMKEEMEETYTLAQIPHTPLSVMQINKLIEASLLEEAHVNLLALRLEFQREQQQCGEDSSVELANKEKDLKLLYLELRNSVVAAVSEWDRGVPPSVARLIQEEEKRAQEPGGLTGSWMEAWREAVAEGVRRKVDGVPLESKEQNSSWLAVHLALLGRTIVEDLEQVKRVLRWSYPASFRVFSTYVKSHHRAVGRHLSQLGQQATELKDLYVLLDWIFNTYKSQRIMGSECLQPEMKDESSDLELDQTLLKELQEKYCCTLKDDLHTSLDNIIELESKETWRNRKCPQKEDDVLDSPIHMDIWTKVKGFVVNSGKINCELEHKVISVCLKELKDFPKRFETEFKLNCRTVEPHLWTEYHIAYINSFTALQEHMDSYKDTCPGEVDGFRVEVNWLIVRFLQVLEDQFKEDVKPYVRRMMVRKWLSSDVDFKQLYSHTERLSQHCSVMKPPHAQELASRLHYHVVREYVAQLMKNDYSCKDTKHEKAAAKIRQQLGDLSELFDHMSTEDWLCPVGDDLSNIIGQKNKTDIKDHVEALVEHYPDFSRKHLVAVLTFRGLLRGREHQLILQRHTDLMKKLGSGAVDKSRVLFDDMQVTSNTNCLSVLPLSCFGNLLPHH